MTALAKRGVSADIGHEVIAEFVDRGYVDDERLAQSVVAGVAHRPRSRSTVRRELVERGVDRDVAESVVGQIDHDDEVEAARRLAAKKAPSLARLDGTTAFRRLTGALARRGFPPDIVFSVAKETLSARGSDFDDESGTLSS